jgi:farnesyl diphosphate synthase
MIFAGITRLQQLKTGALIGGAWKPAPSWAAHRMRQRKSLRAYARDLGLAFQIADDLLDVEGESAKTGKAVQKDAAAGKATFVSLLGVERARTQAHADRSGHRPSAGLWARKPTCCAPSPASRRARR